MKHSISLQILLVFAVVLATPDLTVAAEQTAADGAAVTQKSIAKLRVDGGVVMLSRNQGPFASGTTDAPLYSEERLMVTSDSSATVIYTDGCQQTFSKPGIYSVAETCRIAAASWDSTNITAAQAGVWVATGAVVVAAVTAQSGSSRKVPPVSH